LNQTGAMGTSFILASNRTSKSDDFKENVSLIIQDLAGMNMDLDNYISLTEAQLKKFLTNPLILKNKRISNAHDTYHELAYSADQGSFKLYIEQNIRIKNDSAYLLTLTIEQEALDSFINIGEKIIHSFKLK
jgi:hypothetical protein